ncbi:ABC transporter ATP-binding protein [Leptolyngbya cf. ectocarpi LEGE 11479]|uniref:ABC transporter ATP-binding protein n=1 Tax=Leptolyngbya cf. ectocarpi LEGE 11479 TaxID=1828722 RepID=A0A928ZT60_LEPEC|nr:ABC transporter ATP-binding protein [Leptolyngbya ectocarpi]MBE9066476.1 ABC transporter ATP-binding protein [Leptolyngbya cf. ectocarpi LEGE 11479]
MNGTIIAQNLGKRYKYYNSQRPATIMEAALSGFKFMQSVQKFWAVKDVTIEIAPGEMLGIIGKNGAGKSTLLQLLGGVIQPDEGQVMIAGRIGALLDLAAGFHSDLTGRENIYVTAISAGLTRREVTQRLDKIIAFTELENFIHLPLRTYSTGMMMRLAFSVAVHTDPQVMLVDEFLSVGDLAFQTKCLNRISELKAQGCAIALVSHSPDQIKSLCNKALWLSRGQMAAYGDPETVIQQYVDAMRLETRKRTPTSHPSVKTVSGFELKVNKNRFGSLEAEVLSLQIQTPNQDSVVETYGGRPLRLLIDYVAHSPVESPIFGISISDTKGVNCYQTNTSLADVALPTILGQGRIALEIECPNLETGQYFIDVGIYEKDWSYSYDFHWQVYPIIIQRSNTLVSASSPSQKWELLSV